MNNRYHLTQVVGEAESEAMDQLAAMRAFVRVVEAGSFTRAAQTLDIPRPTVTKLIQILEAHLRTKLLHRTTRRVTVTDDGAAYYERASKLLGDLDALDGSMTLSQGRLHGRLRIDVPAAVAQHVLIPALPDFHARYPEIQVNVGVSDRLVDLVGENVDCVIRACDPGDQSLIARKLVTLRGVTCASPAYLQRHGEPAHPADLAGEHRTVGFFTGGSGGGPLSLEFVRDGETLEIESSAAISVNECSAYVAAGLAGLGVIQVPTMLVDEHLSGGRLRQVLRDWECGPLPLFIAYPPTRHPSSKLRAFVDWAVELFGRIDPAYLTTTPPAPGAASSVARASLSS